MGDCQSPTLRTPNSLQSEVVWPQGWHAPYSLLHVWPWRVMDRDDPCRGQNQVHRGQWLPQLLPGTEQGARWPPNEHGVLIGQDLCCMYQ